MWIWIFDAGPCSGRGDNAVDLGQVERSASVGEKQRAFLSSTDVVLEVGEEVCGAEDRALLATFAFADVDPPALKVHVADIEIGQLKAPDASVHKSFEDAAISEDIGGVDDLLQFDLGEVKSRGFLLPFSNHMQYFLLFIA